MRFAAFDLMIHTWDLATTFGEEPGIADDLVGEVDGFARRVLDAAPRDGINFGTAGAGSRNRDRLEELVAFTGRDCAWRPSTPS